MPKQRRKRRHSQAEEGSTQGRTTRSSKKTKLSNTTSKQNQSHMMDENESMEETFSAQYPHGEFGENPLPQNPEKAYPKSGEHFPQKRKESLNKEDHFEEIEDSGNENLDTSNTVSLLHEQADVNKRHQELSSQLNKCVSESATRSHKMISEEGAYFLKLCYFICRLVTEAARVWFKSKYPQSKLKKKQKKLKNVLTWPHQDTNSFLHESHEGIVVIYEGLDISAIVQLSKELRKTKNEISEWRKELQINDHSDIAELRRIRDVRNKIAHNNIGEVDVTDFRNMWKTLEDAISRLSRGTLDKHFPEYRAIQLDRRLPGVQIQRAIPTEIRYQHFHLIKRWAEDDKVFAETRYCINAFDLLRSSAILLIVGGKGMGKSALARHLALEMSKFQNYEIVPVLSFMQVLEYRDMEIDQVFLLGDVFTNSLRYNQDLSSFLSSRYDILQSLQRSKIIITCKPSIFQKLLQHDIVNRKDIQCIDIEEAENSLNVEEKFNILQNHCKLMNVDEHSFALLSLDSKIEMFPYICEKFSKRKDYQSLGQLFFDNPFYFLKEEFKILRDSRPLHFASLVLLLMQDDRRLTYHILAKDENRHKKTDILNCCVETNIVTDFSIMQTLRSMNDEFTTEQGENEYVFKHGNIADVLACFYGSLFPEQILKHMPSDYVCNNICLEDMTVDTVFTVKITRSLYSKLVRRLYVDISSRDPQNLFNIFKSRCLQCPEFLDVFIAMLDDMSEEELVEVFLEDFKIDDSMLDVYEKILTYNERTRSSDMRSELWEYELLFGLHRLGQSNNKVIKIRVISWIVYYGHEAILTYLLRKTKKDTDQSVERRGLFPKLCKYIYELITKQDLSSFRVFSIDEDELVRILTLGCCTGKPGLVQLILDNFPKNWMFKDTINFTSEIKDTHETRCRRHTPLTASCRRCNREVVELLLKAGVDVSQPDGFQYTPLMSTADQGSLEIAEVLVEKGADVNQQGYNSMSPLHLAAKRSRLDVVKFLISKEAWVNVCNVHNVTPLHITCSMGNWLIVKELLDGGANCFCRTIEGVTPTEIALWNKHTDILRKWVENLSIEEKYKRNEELYTHLVELRHSDVVLDERYGANGVRIVKRGPYSLPTELWDIIFSGTCTDLQWLLSIGFNPNQLISVVYDEDFGDEENSYDYDDYDGDDEDDDQSDDGYDNDEEENDINDDVSDDYDEDEEEEERSLLYEIIHDEDTIDRLNKIKILLDVKADLGHRYSNYESDLEHLRKKVDWGCLELIFENCSRRKFEILLEDMEILKIVKQRVRRYSF